MNLFIGNLNPETTDKDLLRIFSEFGEVVSSKIVKDNVTGEPRGFGFVEMADKFHAYDAIDNIDCTFLQGNIISVKEAKSKTESRGGGGGSRFGGGGERSSRPGGERRRMPFTPREPREPREPRDRFKRF